jgi:uncharacterized protein (TIGR02301 family)
VRKAAAALLGSAALLAAPFPAATAEAPASTPTAAAPPPTPAAPEAERPPPYQPQLLRLAEMMGALAYLRDLCGSGDGATFRSKMEALLDAEGIVDSRRQLLAGAYNRGFHDYETTYRVCTPAAMEVVARFLNETARLAAEMASRYGG